MYQIGKITNTHGIKGEVKIYNLSDFNRFSIGAEVYIVLKEEKKVFTIERVRPQGKLLIVKFKGYDNINDILMYKGLELYSDEDVTDELEDDDYHYHDLIDKDVYTDQNVYVGKVVSMIPVPQGHLLEIEKKDGTKAMVPFIKVFVSEVLEDKIIITPIEGLI
ncbi:ribosome maturation factor RimM [Peloplasma aerotolerans]|uniref:Ribosome maturation factor RimM n=1 Tax=Peloplasma aerotolerans TaxID=3044389 RepID=A0AAW6UD63_9MOLU|nr:ribosome maturation factor RimM [Mariniplasma sp. M4Ah]MDI6452923.1 ribosome maturation factor RimM [Mariniplasma sp. M4Ah]MDR4968315.1 ribosome maturation factor RimM [Acholeplasmataceae bacterium]